MSEEHMVTERIMEACKQLINALSYLASTLHNLALLISRVLKKELVQYYFPRKDNYNAKYWKITDDRKLDIKLMVSSMGSNEKCYYSKMDR